MPTDVTSALLEVVVGGPDGMQVESALLEVVVAADVDSTQVHSALLEVVVAADLPTGPGGAGPDCLANEPGTRLWWALDVDLGGVTHHIGTRTGEIDGVVYRAGLDDLSLSRLEDLSSAVGIRIQTGDDWATSFAAAQWLVDGGRARLYLVVEEGGTARRILWMAGYVDGTTWGRSLDPVTFEIRPTLGEPTIPSPREKVDSFTRPATSAHHAALGSLGASTDYEVWEDSLGLFYPLIIGYPGHVPGGVSQCVVPAPVAQANWVDITVDGADTESVPEVIVYVIAGGGGVDASKVWVLETGITTTRTTAGGKETQIQQTDPADITLVQGADALGQRNAWWHWDFDAEEQSGTPALYVGFSKESGFGGGVKHNGRVVNGASDIFEWVVSRYTTATLDLGRHKVSSKVLSRYLFDLVVNETIPVMDWFDSQILRYLPAAVVRGNEGVYLAHIPLRASPVESVLDLVAGDNAQRAGMSVTSTADVVNELTYSWGPLRDGQAYHQTRIITAQSQRVSKVPDGVVYADTRAFAEGLCIVSQRAYREARQGTLEMPTVWDPGTAQRIAEDHVVRRAFPERTFRYVLGEVNHWVMPGDVVTLTDADLGLSTRLCAVVDVVISPPTVEVTLRPIRNLSSYL